MVYSTVQYIIWVLHETMTIQDRQGMEEVDF